jgi:hypothetical protein
VIFYNGFEDVGCYWFLNHQKKKEGPADQHLFSVVTYIGFKEDGCYWSLNHHEKREGPVPDQTNNGLKILDAIGLRTIKRRKRGQC